MGEHELIHVVLSFLLGMKNYNKIQKTHGESVEKISLKNNKEQSIKRDEEMSPDGSPSDDDQPYLYTW